MTDHPPTPSQADIDAVLLRASVLAELLDEAQKIAARHKTELQGLASIAAGSGWFVLPDRAREVLESEPCRHLRGAAACPGADR